MEIVSSAFFFRNYHVDVVPITPVTNHYWSLAVEEHFYLPVAGLAGLAGNHASAQFHPLDRSGDRCLAHARQPLPLRLFT